MYTLRDQLNSSNLILNQSGTVVTNGNQYATSYGGNRGGTPFSTLTTKRFTGQYHENGLTQSEGLSYYGARWYDAKLGRFLSADSLVPQPADPQSLNRYSYVRNNPTGRIDPTGHADIAMDDGNGGGSSSRLPVSVPAWRPQSQYSAWYSGAYSGCFMCHAGGGRVLANTELLESWQRMNQTQRTGVELGFTIAYIAVAYGAAGGFSSSQAERIGESNDARHLIPIELSSSARPGTIVAQNAQTLIRADLPQTVISAHGQYDPLLPAIRQPGTTLVYYSGPGGQITNELGNLIELGKVPADVMRFVYPPGTNAPNLRLRPLPPGLTVGNPVEPSAEILLSDLDSAREAASLEMEDFIAQGLMLKE